MATEFAEGTHFGVHSDDAPTYYIDGNPGQLTRLPAGSNMKPPL